MTPSKKVQSTRRQTRTFSEEKKQTIFKKVQEAKSRGEDLTEAVKRIAKEEDVHTRTVVAHGVCKLREQEQEEEVGDFNVDDYARDNII